MPERDYKELDVGHVPVNLVTLQMCRRAHVKGESFCSENNYSLNLFAYVWIFIYWVCFFIYLFSPRNNKAQLSWG